VRPNSVSQQTTGRKRQRATTAAEATPPAPLHFPPVPSNSATPSLDRTTVPSPPSPRNVAASAPSTAPATPNTSASSSSSASSSVSSTPSSATGKKRGRPPKTPQKGKKRGRKPKIDGKNSTRNEKNKTKIIADSIEDICKQVNLSMEDVLARFAQIVQETKETDGEGASWMENFILQVQCKNKTELKERKKAAKQRKTF
jgi:hypothetical protein